MKGMAMRIDRVLCFIKGQGKEAVAAAVVEAVRGEVAATVARLPPHQAPPMPA